MANLQNSYHYSHPHIHQHHHDGKVVKLEPEQGGEYSFHAHTHDTAPPPPPPPPPAGPPLNAPDLPPAAIAAAIRQSAAVGRRPMMHPVDMDANEILKVRGGTH